MDYMKKYLIRDSYLFDLTDVINIIEQNLIAQYPALIHGCDLYSVLAYLKKCNVCNKVTFAIK